jgi:hypothetical protein
VIGLILSMAAASAQTATPIYMRGITLDQGVADFKTSKRCDIESRGFRVIASIGDQKSDLEGGCAEMTFKVPNPFYFIPSNSP